MPEIELSIWERSSASYDQIEREMETFRAQYYSKVNVRVYPIASVWAEIMKIVLYRHGPDVSEVGTTWISSLVSMNGLRPFNMADIRTLGGANAFVEPVWKAGMTPEETKVWGIPYCSDPRVVFYRRDLLEKAGIGEKTAFDTPENFEWTLQRLQEHGVVGPLSLTVGHEYVTLHNISSWIRGYGGDFVHADGKSLMIDQPEARAGLRAYFNLHRYLHPALFGPAALTADNLFAQGQTAVTVSGPWLYYTVRRGDAAPEVMEHLGAALVPGVSYLGGMHLVVWGHCRSERDAANLVRFLVSEPVQTAIIPLIGELPSRISTLETLTPYAEDAVYQVMVQSVKAGKSLPMIRLWGLVEDKLVEAFNFIWQDLHENPQDELDAILDKHLDPLIRRLNMTLSG